MQATRHASRANGKSTICSIHSQKDALAKHGFQEHCIWPEAKPGLPAHKKRYWDAYIIRDGEKIDTSGKFGPDVFTDYSIDFMKRHRDEPFLLYQSAILTHIPVTTTPTSPDENASPREKFAGMLHYADHLIGRMVEALDELGLRDNTLLIIATDNGTDTGSDQGMQQSLGGMQDGRVSDEGIYSLTERGINMPLIVNCPAWIPTGCESDALLNAADVLPTLAELAGAKLPEDVVIDGRSFASVLRDNSDESWQRPWTFTQYADSRIVRDHRYKLYSSGEFFDLAVDPLERNALPKPDSDDAQSDVASPAAIRARFAARRTPSGRGPFVASRREKLASPRTPPAEPLGFSKTNLRRRNLPSYSSRRASTKANLASFVPHSSSPIDSQVKSAEDWQRRRNEILDQWHEIMGPWPDLIERPVVESVKITRRDNITQRQLRIGIGIRGEMVDAFMLIPDGDGPFPAVVVPYYDAQSGVGLGLELRDFGWQLAQRGFVALAIGKPNSIVNFEDYRDAGHQGQYFGSAGEPVNVQPLSALAYAAANAHTVLTQRPEVYPDRIGIVGHSFGGKWSLFASCLYDKFACAVWSDPGIVFDERDRRKQNPGGSVNYWDEWYLGFELGKVNNPDRPQRFRKLPSRGRTANWFVPDADRKRSRFGRTSRLDGTATLPRLGRHSRLT